MSVKDGGQKSSAASRPSAMKLSNSSKRPTKASGSMQCLEKKQKHPGKLFNGRNHQDHKQIPSSLGSSNGDLKAHVVKQSIGSIDSPKDGSGVRSSTGSCHDACKFGSHGTLPDSNTAKSGAKGITKKISRVGVAKKPAAASPSSNSSSSSSRIMRAIKVCRVELNSVNNSHVQSAAKSVKPSNASKVKVARSLFRSPRGAVACNDSHYHVTPNKILGSEVKNNNTMAGNSIERNPEPDVFNLEFESEADCLICDDQSEDEFFRQYYSPCAGEPAEHSGLFDMDIASRERYSPCPGEPAEHNGLFDMDIAGRERHNVFEADSHHQEDVDRPYDGGLQSYGSEYSENTNPRSLDAAHIVKGGRDHINMKYDGNSGERLRFNKVDGGIIRHSSDSNSPPENVVLRHQDMQVRKPSEEWKIDHVIGEAVNRLSNQQESKVKVLVGAFETVISLTDQSLETPEPKHDVNAKAPLPNIRHIQACN